MDPNWGRPPDGNPAIARDHPPLKFFTYLLVLSHPRSMSDSEQLPEILTLIDILDGLEALIDNAPNEDIEDILEEAWLEISDTLPEDFKAATQHDAGAEGLRRYLKVKAFFENPSERSISAADLEEYYRSYIAAEADTDTDADEESTDFFSPE